jgi:predicted ATP-grasp superfamily ATP-dependent carboligase
MKRVLVFDANQRSALAVTRSLGRKGVPVFTADETSTSLAGSSRFSRQHFHYPSPRLNPLQFVDFIDKLTRKLEIEILLPMTELTTSLLLKYKTRLPETKLPFPANDAIEHLADKCSLMRIAESLNVPVPRTWYINDPASPHVDPDKLTYPAVLKPAASWLLHHGQWLRASVRIAQNPTEVGEIMQTDFAFRAYPYMIQECVTGQGQGVFALYDKGNPVTFFAHKRLREKPPQGGVSVLSESTAVDPLLLTHARNLLDHTGWHGVAMVEFKVSSDGTPYLMEINTRFWGSLQLAIDAGVDFPWLLYQIACNEKPDSTSDYKTGKRLRWLLGDLDNLYLTLRDKHCSLRSKLFAVSRFITPAPIITRHEVNRWEDLGPAWYEIKTYMKDILN